MNEITYWKDIPLPISHRRHLLSLCYSINFPMVYLKNSDNFMLNTIAENKKVNLAASSFRLVFLNL